MLGHRFLRAPRGGGVDSGGGHGSLAVIPALPRLRAGVGRNDRSDYAGSRYGSNASIEILIVGSASGPHSSWLLNTTV